MISIQYEPEDLVVKIPKELVPSEYVQRFLERLRVDAVLEKSGATDEQITALSEAVKGDWWSANKGQFLKGSPD